MRKLAVILASFIFAPGCIIVTDSDDRGAFDVAWTLTAAEDGSVVGCPPDATTAEVVATNIDTGEEFIDCFDCTAGSGITADLPIDGSGSTYDINVNITDAGPGECGVGSPALIAGSGFATATLEFDGDLIPVDFEFPVDGGFFQAAWVLEDAQGELDCSQVQQDGVSVLSTLVGPNSGFDDVFDCVGDGTCGDQCGTTAVLPTGDYEVVIDLIDEQGSIASCGDQISTSIEFGNELVDLGTAVCSL